MQYITCIAQSLPLARKLAGICCLQLRAMLLDDDLLQRHRCTQPEVAAAIGAYVGRSKSQSSTRQSLDVPGSNVRGKSACCFLFYLEVPTFLVMKTCPALGPEGVIVESMSLHEPAPASELREQEI